jgi:ATP-dependent exoDNAse (exonuclease V) beta subunit
LPEGETELSTRVPNQEQKIAIEKNGGVLLSAGAGSGKTFVIIEHIVFKILELRKKYSFDYFENNITSMLSEITLMTFTKKATGEMSIRLMRRIEELMAADSNADRKFWNLIYNNTAAIKILTIHGLCHHLLRSGYWPDFPMDIDLLDSMSHRNKVKKLFDQWYELNEIKLKPQFLAHTHELFVAILEIFNSPELRILWSSPRSKADCATELDYFFVEWIKLRNLQLLFKTRFDYSSDKKKSDKKIYQALQGFSLFVQTEGALSGRNFKSYLNFYAELGRFPSPSKDMTELETSFRAEMQTLQKDLKNLGDDLLDFESNFNSYNEWAHILQSVFQYINNNYQSLAGFSFSDLEYYVYRGLANSDVTKKIRETYKYFIVDEFQDTSFVQFDILQKLTGMDFSKLYAVGDRKQAIYGFRGGELQVFQDCEKLMGAGNLFLKFNYRSQKNIVEFNNQFFTQIFPLGHKFEDRDLHNTQMEEQEIPDVKTIITGNVYSLRADLSEESKAQGLDLAEARFIANEIAGLLLDDTINNICVLYKKLSPSYILIDLLKEKGIAFTAQIKIAFQDDPLLSLFRFIVEYSLNIGDHQLRLSCLFKLNALCEILGVSRLSEELLASFIGNAKILGIKNSFMKLLLDLGITSSFYEQNLSLLSSICKLGEDNYLQIYHLLKEGDDEYSTELISGSQKKRVFLMTAHASKGLEFDAVVLGGVHTNGRYLGMSEKVGKLPNSFRYKVSFDQKQFNKSPAYFLEAEIIKQKSFSENKRLLYVACSRAISKLIWVDLRSGSDELISDPSSWIKALRMSDVAVKTVTMKDSEFRISKDISFLQKDSLGILVHDSPLLSGVTSELSVTRLATLIECAFKFYLQNICKINLSEKFYLEEEDSDVPVFYSSKERGTNIHLLFSKILKNHLDAAAVPRELTEMFSWVQSLKSNYDGYTCVSEETIKFSFFNNMISGTPDAYFLSADNLAIWDFKTGLRDELNENAYWFQLMTYALGLGKIYPRNIEGQIELSLLYVDEKKCITKKLSYSDISRELFSVWKKTESLYQVNLDHCSRCDYSTICNKSCL